MKRVVLPLVEPVYSTYHSGLFSAIIKNNPTIYNFYINQVMKLTCNRKFLFGYSTPYINVLGNMPEDNPYLETIEYPLRYLMNYIDELIEDLIDKGYYIHFNGIDDFYVKGKSWYNKRHFNHDGGICGYDQNEKSLCIYAYNQNWIYETFWTPQNCFIDGINAMLDKGYESKIIALKPKKDNVQFSLCETIRNLKNYLESEYFKVTDDTYEHISGILVHDYIVVYLNKLLNGDIPYEKIDRRIFRMIWEHKKLMLERIKKIEKSLNSMNPIYSGEYAKVVNESNSARMLYAIHCVKRNDDLLKTIKNKLIWIRNNDCQILNKLVNEAERRMDLCCGNG